MEEGALTNGMEKKGPMTSVDSLHLYIEDENKNSIWINTNSFSHLQPSPFHTLPRTNKCKTQNIYENAKLQNVLRKISGIPLAITYGFIFTIILKYMILNDLPGRFYIKPAKRYNKNFSCEFELNSTLNDSTKYHYLDKTITTTENNGNVAYITSAFTLTLGISSIFSRGTRCSMLLILPSLVTKRSRTFLFAFVMGLLADGPIDSLSYNLNQIVDNSACIYDLITKVSCMKKQQLKTIYVHVRDFRGKVITMFQGWIDSAKSLDVVNIDMKIPPTAAWPDFSSLVKAPQLSEIKAQVDIIVSGISDCRIYVAVLRKILTILSILLMVLDAIRYLRSYYSDYAFDNMHISKRIQKFWRQYGYTELTPMRQWEKNEGYHVSTKFSKQDCYMILRNGLPTFIFAFVAAIIMLADFLLAEMLRFIINKDDITVAFEGVDHNFGVAHVQIKQLNVSTDTCLRAPLYTSVYINIGISFFLIIAILSCVFEVYTSSFRSAICNMFYNNRFRERADYLYRKIIAGRMSRTLQFQLIVKNEVERRERLESFFPWTYFRTYCSTYCGISRTKKGMTCPGCKWRVKELETRTLCFISDNRKMSHKVCKNCLLDYEESVT